MVSDAHHFCRLFSHTNHVGRIPFGLVFHNVHISVVDNIFFTPFMSLEDLQRSIVPFLETNLTAEQKFIVDEVLPLYLRIRSDQDSTFLSRFTALATGLAHLPANSHIYVHFEGGREIPWTSEEEQTSPIRLPIFHACVHIISLPWEAYHGDANTFIEKMDICMEYAAHTFNRA